MPIREYKCEKCGVFEHLHLKMEEWLKYCPTCSGSITSLMSASNLQFNGSGFYCNDYKSKTDSTTSRVKNEKKVNK